MKRLRMFGILGICVLAAGWIAFDRLDRGGDNGPREGREGGAGGEPPARLAGSDTAVPPAPGPDDEAPRLILQVRTDPPDATYAWRGSIRRLRVPNWTKANEIPGWEHPLEGSGAEIVGVALPQPGIFGVEIGADGLHGQVHRFMESFAAGASRTFEVRFVPPSTLAGSVRDVTDAALADATVSVFGGSRASEGHRSSAEPLPPLTARTDQRGEFEIEGLDPLRDYTVAAVLVGFAPVRVMDVRMAPGERHAVRLVLQPAARATGRLLDAGGAPLVNATIRVARIDEAALPNEFWVQEGEATTDANGEYEIDSLTPGLKRFFVLTEYAMGTTAVAQWTSDLQGGALTDLRETQVADSEVVFRVTLPSGDPTPSARIHVVLVPEVHAGEAPPSAIMLYVFTDDTGVGRVRGLPAGTLSARVSDMSGTPGIAVWRRSLDFDGRAAQVAVRLEGDDPRPPENGLAVIECERVRSGALLLVRDGGSLIKTHHWGAAPDEDRVRFELERPAGTTARALLVSGGKHVEAELLFEPGEPSPIRLAPTVPGTRVRARVERSGRPQAHALLNLLLPSEDGGEMEVFLGMTNAQGEVVLDGVPRLDGAVIAVGGVRGRDIGQGLRQRIDWDADPCEVLLEIP